MGNLNSIGTKIKKYRIMMGFTQSQLASELSDLTGKNYSQSAITGFEIGTRSPKIETRIQIANVLNVDPIELSDIPLSETDEKRLLCKLLRKYAKSISGEDDGSVNVRLDEDFWGFASKYNDVQGRLDFLNEDMDPESDPYKKNLQDAESEMSFWIETYPKFDPVTSLKNSGQPCSVNASLEVERNDENRFIQRLLNYMDEWSAINKD